MKHNKQEILDLREKGYSIRAIQKKLKMNSPSAVHYHIANPDKRLPSMKRIAIDERLTLVESKINEICNMLGLANL